MTPIPKPEPARKAKRRRYLANRAVVRAVRAEVFARERETCAVVSRLPKADMLAIFTAFGICQGPLQHAHLKGKRKSATRGQAPEERHQTATSLALCELHHEAEEHKGLRFIGLTKAGMDGPITFHIEPPKARVVH